jgi:hypothetical protein
VGMQRGHAVGWEDCRPGAWSVQDKGMQQLQGMGTVAALPQAFSPSAVV